ncbi:E3 ubiquitin ligase BIG BROTHER-related-like isoform X2 [Tasmannia lanceolata]|uniref:E3 ubiquitin ligase BIG BROTHER-related-like isoform X2 n=1 Tax=Tasmannia lanceolata TaxID=3420 RepID=UPI0040646734
MDNAKEACEGDKTNDENPNPNPNPELHEEIAPNSPSQPPSRTPFTSLSQVESDLALARRLQEQERAYLMLTMNNLPGAYSSSESGSSVHSAQGDDDLNEDESADGDDDLNEDENADGDGDLNEDGDSEAVGTDSVGIDIDPSAYDNDEDYARALQDAEAQAAIHMMALGINDWESEEEDLEDNDSNSQDPWQEVDPDELSYEELLALGEVVGTESRGLSPDTIASLPSVNYKAQSSQDGNTDQCVICRLDFEDGDTVIVLSCKHSYHPECINNWLQIIVPCLLC